MIENKHQPSLPSAYLARALRYLRLELEDWRQKSISGKADSFQLKYMEGKPSITMAAFLSLSMPYIADHNLQISRSKAEICRAFDVSISSMSERIISIKTHDAA